MKILLALPLLLLAACAAENDNRAVEQPAAKPVETAAPVPSAPVPQPESPAAVVVAEPAPPAAPKQGDTVSRGEPGKVDTRCATRADCVVKDVGNCCGYFPACVNRNSPVFPEQVRAACEAEGRASICGFREITGCECVAGECQAAGTPDTMAQ